MKSKVLLIFKNVFDYVYFVYINYNIFRFVLTLGFLVLFLDYFSLSLLIPISSIGNNQVQSTNFMNLIQIIGLNNTGGTWIWLFLITLFLRSILGYLYDSISISLGKKIQTDFSLKIFENFLNNQGMNEVYQKTIGYYISMIGDNTFKIGFLFHHLLHFILGVSSTLVGVLILFNFSHYLFFVFIVYLIISGFIVLIGLIKISNFSKEAIEVGRKTNTGFVDAMNGLRSIKTLRAENFVYGKYASGTKIYTKALTVVDNCKNFIRLFPGILGLGIAIIWLSPFNDAPWIYKPNELIAGITIILRIFSSLSGVVSSASVVFSDASIIEEVLHKIQNTKKTIVINNSIDNLNDIRFIELSNVSHAYNNQKIIFDNLSLKFESGKVYCISGSSGAGKSTLADILAGLVIPNQGYLIVDKASSINNAGVYLVEQAPKIFSGTIFENVTMGENHKVDDIYKVLDILDLKNFVIGLPNQLETQLDYQGSNLSGGQRQRLSIARVLLKSPKFLILDEALSGVEDKLRKQIIFNIKLNFKYTAIIIISHDNDIRQISDEVIFLK